MADPIATPAPAVPAAPPEAAKVETAAESKPAEKIAPEAAAAAEKQKVERKAMLIAAAHRQERHIREEKAKVAANAKELEVQIQLHAARLARADEFDRLEKVKGESKLKFLQESKIDFKDVAGEVIKGENRSAADIADEKIAAFKAEMAAADAAKAAAITKAEAEARDAAIIKQHKGKLAELAKDDKYELVRETGSIDDAWKVIEEYYTKTGEVLALDAALQAVESELEKQQDKLYATSKKLKAKLAPVVEAKKEPLKNLDRPFGGIGQKAKQAAPSSETPAVPSPEAPRKPFNSTQHARDLIASLNRSLDS